jgi:DNA segregation ATPase FtsK/SpoIIIE, S-DNA-T family
VPSDLNLSQSKDIPWGTQFSEIYKRPELKETEFPIPLGFDDQNNLKVNSLPQVNNLIIAGNPLSQKENLIDTILLTYFLRYKPTELKLILNDTTRYLNLYDGIPHLLSPVINESDKVLSCFKWALAEADRRLLEFSRAGVRDLKAFNQEKIWI